MSDVNPKADQTLENLEPGYRRAPMKRAVHGEGSLTRAIEQTTARLPSSAFLTASIAAMTASAVFELAGNPRASRFVGMWAPTLLIMGVYNKLVKMHGPI